MFDFLKCRDAVGADGVGRACGNPGCRGALELARAPVLLQILPLRGPGGLFLRINAAGVQAVGEAELVVEDEWRARADAFPLFFERRGGLVLGPRPEVGGGEVLEVMRPLAELALRDGGGHTGRTRDSVRGGKTSPHRRPTSCVRAASSIGPARRAASAPAAVSGAMAGR